MSNTLKLILLLVVYLYQLYPLNHRGASLTMQNYFSGETYYTNRENDN